MMNDWDLFFCARPRAETYTDIYNQEEWTSCQLKVLLGLEPHGHNRPAYISLGPSLFFSLLLILLMVSERCELTFNVWDVPRLHFFFTLCVRVYIHVPFLSSPVVVGKKT